MRGNSNRFYYKNLDGGQQLEVDDRVLLRQWRKVMRFGPGDVVKLFDGSGWEYDYQIQESKNRNSNRNQKSAEMISLKMIDKRYVKDSVRKIWLGFGILNDQARLEWMVEKCTELGVDGFVPLEADNCQIGKLRRVDRLEKKIIEASEQCGRVRVPSIGNIRNVNDLDSFDDWMVIVMNKNTNPETHISALKLKIRNHDQGVLLLVGPEGGWSESEWQYFLDKKIEFMSINENVLRTETAAIVGIGLINLTNEGSVDDNLR